MRKGQQQQILELLQTMGQAQSAGLYADCRDGALTIGEFIEHVEGKRTRSVEMLEEYCELLLKASNGETGERTLRKHLNRVENSVRHELKPNKIEVAFLSYNASMSDAVESIYLAAKADPDCDAYWIPIPYFERNENGSCGAMHYEGADHYGDNVVCTDWRKYDIKARRPDAIFTFAPYDSSNLVTSVHPDFYCERLRNLTDLLVYVPYFVAVDDVPEHFCTVAGCVFAHRVVLQSEKIRQTYIRAFRKRYGNKFGKPEDKFIALGSPKYDKYIRLEREDSALPREWERLIAGRKVVLFNSNVSAMLAGNEQYLEKLRHAIDAFRSRSDVALWWRPHPLTESTCKSMRPRLLDEYRQIVANYKREAWGIYDDTSDLPRALVWSDAYYGNMSSVVSLYQATGKPLLVETSFLLTYENLYDDGEQLWLTDLFNNALVKLDRSTWEPEYAGSFPSERMDGQRLYTSTVEMDGKLYFTPFSADAIAVYDKASKQFGRIDLDYHSEDSPSSYDKASKFYSAVKYGKYIFFIPFSFPAIVRYDTENGKVDYFSDWREDYESRVGGTDRPYLKGSIVIGHYIYAVAASTNAVLVFDAISCESQLHTVGKDEFCYSGICHDGTDFWLSPRFGNAVVKWNAPTGRCRVFELPGNRRDNEKFAFSDIVIMDGNVIVLPYNAGMGLKINLHNAEMSLLDIRHDPGQQHNRYLAGQVIENQLYAYEGSTSQLVRYDLKTDQCRARRIELSEADSSAFAAFCSDGSIAATVKSDKPYCETYKLPLPAFISMVVRNSPAVKQWGLRGREAFFSDNANTDGTAGAVIFAHCKRHLLGATKKG